MTKYEKQAGVYCINQGWRFCETNEFISTDEKGHDAVYGMTKGGAAGGPASADFDDSDWEKIILPHDWVTRKPFSEDAKLDHGYKERGSGWYRFSFCLEEEDRNKQILLEFEGMSASAKIYVNGMLLKRNESGYNSFCVDMSDMAHFGLIPNVLAVWIDAAGWEGWWYEGAGIYRNVWLIKKPALHIAYQGVAVFPKSEEDGSWKLVVETTLENSFEDIKRAKVSSKLLDAQGKVVGETETPCCLDGYSVSCQRSELVIQSPQLWQLEKPVLYQVRVSICESEKEIDFQCCETGFRTIQLDADTGFWLNGVPVKLKGFCNHQDHTGVGVAVPYPVKEYRIGKLKELGANAYRCAHNPDPDILEICDHMGMLVMEENRTFSSEETNLEGLRGIVRNARNHPSVILYAVGNEEQLFGTEKGRRIAGRMRAAIRELDTTRPVMAAFNSGYLEKEGAAAVLDAVGINYNQDRYDVFHSQFPDVPLIGSETVSSFMVRGEYGTDWEKHVIDNYDRECAMWGNTVRDMWRCIDARPFVAGTFVWTGFDYRGEPTPFEWPSVASFFGAYDSCGYEKDACYLYRALWKQEPVVHLVSPWKERSNIGRMITVAVYTNCDEIRLSVNGNTIAQTAVDLYEQYTLEVICEEGELKVEGLRNNEAVASDVQRTEGKKAGLCLWTENTAAVDADFGAAIIHVSVIDEYGEVLPNADDMIHFHIENGTILGVGNGDPNSHEPDIALQRKAFHGRAQAIIRADTEAPLCISAFADGLEEKQLVIPVKRMSGSRYLPASNERIVGGWRMYMKLFDEMPDPAMKADGNDMNSFEPIEFTGSCQPVFTGQLHRFGLYRTVFDFTGKRNRRFLYFYEVSGNVWIYLDGEKLAERVGIYNGPICVDLPQSLQGRHELSVIIENACETNPWAGIVKHISFRCES